MEYTSICKCKTANYQIDHAGDQDIAIDSFESWCAQNDAVWAHLFSGKTGEWVATFNNVQGLTTIL